MRKKDSRGHVRDDCIVKQLRKSLGRRAWAGVEPGTIVCTRAGELERDDRNKVQLLLHVAVQHSEHDTRLFYYSGVTYAA